MEWSIAGTPLPDLPFLYGPDYAEMHRKANEIMRGFRRIPAPNHRLNPLVEDLGPAAIPKRAQDAWESR